ncbi:MmcQ/YjbR family DNA-binding protein [Chromobacterium sp. IIBBL 290-4]|uniref:MmcQ/YjbR family DNA-binding protein n=1 Tax=Chromobacterium sp. IIBBL 290-4 TaxID=2953890 RepID=UPI0020B87003|nr:MmcQ/YjbR family DNA-binding protein [Chromobacterium sp. IIBBL 290-4]UTH75787.1 MmcQ/YjbR family DNA-binding protein [Chromobacterium sp. IIBBL 290-4]
MNALPEDLIGALLAYACALPGAEFDIKWGGARVVSICGKMFLLCGEQGVSYKVPDEDFLALSGLPGVRPAPYLARARWVQTLTLEALTADDLRAGIARSRELVLAKLPKVARLKYGAPA